MIVPVAGQFVDPLTRKKPLYPVSVNVGVAVTGPLGAVRAEFAPHEKKMFPELPAITLVGVAVSGVPPVVPQLGVNVGSGVTVTKGTF